MKYSDLFKPIYCDSTLRDCDVIVLYYSCILYCALWRCYYLYKLPRRGRYAIKIYYSNDLAMVVINYNHNHDNVYYI